MSQPSDLAQTQLQTAPSSALVPLKGDGNNDDFSINTHASSQQTLLQHQLKLSRRQESYEVELRTHMHGINTLSERQDSHEVVLRKHTFGINNANTNVDYLTQSMAMSLTKQQDQDQKVAALEQTCKALEAFQQRTESAATVVDAAAGSAPRAASKGHKQKLLEQFLIDKHVKRIDPAFMEIILRELEDPKTGAKVFTSAKSVKGVATKAGYSSYRGSDLAREI